jgi:hypothetical protein
MKGARRLKANRVNAQASTGPKTRQGKTRSAQNSRCHGLNVPVLRDPTISKDVDKYARIIAGGGTPHHKILECARRIAEAQLDVRRVRQARLDVLANYLSKPDFRPRSDRSLAQVDGLVASYARRYGAMTPLPPDVARLAKSVLEMKYQGVDKFVWILRDLSQQLALFDRYERRALSRRKFAIRELDFYCRQQKP